MDLEQLQSVRDRERRTDKLQELRESFYADAAELIATLRAERDDAAAAADDLFDDSRVNRLSDQINTAERTVEAIYEKRVGKLVKAASFAAADMPVETKGMTAEERELFDALVANIRTNRRRVLDGIVDDGEPAATGAAVGSLDDSAASPAQGEDDTAADTPPPPPDRQAAEPPDEPSGDAESEEAADDESPAAAGEPDEDVERATVRITTDVGEIFGVDEREYHLEADDVVTLPAANAEPLLERDAAELIE